MGVYFNESIFYFCMRPLKIARQLSKAYISENANLIMEIIDRHWGWVIYCTYCQGRMKAGLEA